MRGTRANAGGLRCRDRQNWVGRSRRAQIVAGQEKSKRSVGQVDVSVGREGGGRAAAVALVTLYLALLGLWSVQTLQKQERKGLTMRSPPQAHEQRRTKELGTTMRSPLHLNKSGEG